MTSGGVYDNAMTNDQLLLDDETLERFLSGHTVLADELAPLARFADELRLALDGPMPSPRPDLARLLSVGVPVESPVRSMRLGVATKVGKSRLFGARVAVGVCVALAGVLGAGAAGALPATAQHLVSEAVSAVTPVHLPDPEPDPAPPPGHVTPLPAADLHASTPGADAPAHGASGGRGMGATPAAVNASGVGPSDTSSQASPAATYSGLQATAAQGDSSQASAGQGSQGQGSQGQGSQGQGSQGQGSQGQGSQGQASQGQGSAGQGSQGQGSQGQGSAGQGSQGQGSAGQGSGAQGNGSGAQGNGNGAQGNGAQGNGAQGNVNGAQGNGNGVQSNGNGPQSNGPQGNGNEAQGNGVQGNGAQGTPPGSNAGGAVTGQGRVSQTPAAAHAATPVAHQ